jgi:hypothetical protein
MEYAVRLFGPHSPEQAIALFNEWADGLTLEIVNDPVTLDAEVYELHPEFH